MSRAGEADQSRVADLVEEVLGVNRMLHAARDWREREVLSSRKAGLLSSAIILLQPAALGLRRQSMPGRSEPYLLVTFIASGRSRSFGFLRGVGHEHRHPGALRARHAVRSHHHVHR